MGEILDMRANPDDIAALKKLMSDIDLTGVVMLEVGSYRGQSAEAFLSTGLVRRLYCVDQWESGYDGGDKASSSDMAAVEADFDARMAKFGDKVVKCKGRLRDFAEKLGKVSFDAAYVDGDHRYEGCLADLSFVKEVLKPAVIAGHDYCSGWPGVMKAVEEVPGKPDKVYSEYSWLKRMR